MHVYIIGTGPGNPALLTGQAKAAIEASPILVGDKRMLAPFAASGKRLVATYRRDDICQLAASLSDEEGPMAILVSGDVGFFSLAALLTDIPGCTVTRIAGISSLVYFAAVLQTTWNDLSGTAADFTDRPADSLAVMMVENEKARLWVRPVHGLPDEAFLRGKAPMTKQEIRSVALSKLAPEADAVVCDIGAGTGSCTVELALQAPFGHVYAFEINEEALTVLQQNIGHFGLTNVTVVAGDASQTLKTLDIAPDYAFIGGTKGNLASILDDLYDKNEACRMVITAISLETLAAVTAYYAARNGYQLDITQVSTARSKQVGQHHLMMAQNPVYIMTAVRQDAGEA